MFLQLLLTSVFNPTLLNFSRTLLKNSELQFVPSLLKEKQFNDTVKGLTIFVDNKNIDGTYDNVFIRDEGKVLTDVSKSSSTIFAKSGYVTEDEINLVLLNGYIHTLESGSELDIVRFEKTIINLSGLSTKTISEAKIQETSTLTIIECMREKNYEKHNCSQHAKNLRDTKSEINRRFGMPLYIPCIALLSAFLLISRNESKRKNVYKYFYFALAFVILIMAEILVRYSGKSYTYSYIYYLLPLASIPILYLILSLIHI